MADRDCIDCGKKKHVSEFYSRERRCKPCRIARYRKPKKGKLRNKGAVLVCHLFPKCRDCGKEKNIHEFERDRKRATGHTTLCKACANKRHRKYRADNKSLVRAKARARYVNDPVSGRRYSRTYKRKRLAKLSCYSWFNRRSERYAQHILRGGDMSYEEYVLFQEARPFGWHSKTAINKWINPSVPRDTDRKCRECGAPSGGKTFCSQACSWRWRYHNDMAFNVWERTRNQFKKWVSGGKESNIIKQLGYGREELFSHIESLFTDGMSWDNYGEWHIDHIIPKIFFDPNDKHELLACWSLENLRPLWGRDNCKRSAYPSIEAVASVHQALAPSDLTGWGPVNSREHNIYRAIIRACNRHQEKIRGYVPLDEDELTAMGKICKPLIEQCFLGSSQR